MSQSTNIKGALTMLEEILQLRKNEGNDTIPVSSQSLNQLENLPFALMRTGSLAPEPQQQVPQRNVAPAQPQPEAAPRVQPQPTPAVQPQPEPAQPEPKTQPAAQPPPQPAANPYGELAIKVEQRNQVDIIFPAGDAVRDRLNNLFHILKGDAALRSVPTMFDKLVFATGNPEADIMFVGEAPGEEEENAKKPFIGPAGQKLDTIINAMKLGRDKVYLSNILKYRPKINDGRFQGNSNRKPTPEEMAISVKYVRSEIEIVKPKVIIALGGTAAEGLLDIAGSVSGMREQEYSVDGIPVVVTYHPSYLIRLETNKDFDQQRVLSEKRKVWEDMQRAMGIAGMPI